jgi:DnaJ family protein A protein 2
MNYYKILGLNKNASQEDIKKRYRKLALEHHPDKGGDLEKFRQIQEAYEVLSNDNKKQEYDNNYQTRKMNDTQHKIKISLKDIYTGIQKTVKIHTKHICENCRIMCNNCNGMGVKTIQLNLGPFVHMQKIICNDCNASGVKIDKKLDCKCQNGYTFEEKVVIFNIEKGDINKQMYKIQGLGEQPKRDWDLPGDIIIEFEKEESDTKFKRRNLNLEYKCQIKFTDAIVGTILRIQHYTKEIKIDTGKMFGIIDPNREYVLNGEGLTYKEQKGDMIIKFELVYPKSVQYVSESTRDILTGVFKKIEW